MSKSNRNVLVVLAILGVVAFTCCGMPMLMFAVMIAQTPRPAPIPPAPVLAPVASAPAKHKQELRLAIMMLIDKDQNAATQLMNEIDAQGGIDQLSSESAVGFIEAAKAKSGGLAASASAPVGPEVNLVSPELEKFDNAVREARRKKQAQEPLVRRNKADEDLGRIAAWTYAGEFVKKRLKSPSTASFGSFLGGTYQDPLECVTAESDGVYHVLGWVDSQNGFGATVRTEFSLRLRDEGKSWVLLGDPIMVQR